jgi:nucleoside-diphosphate-sugar epimerase
MRVLVTGASGFIASYLIPKLAAAGHEIIGLDKQSTAFKAGLRICFCPLESGDICDGSEMHLLGKELEIDAVVHLAAMAAPRIAESMPEETFKVNVLGTYNVLKLAKSAGARRVVFASTAHVYGISPKYMPTDENAPLALHDTYTTSKILGEQLCDLFFRNYNMAPVILRMFNGYGPGQSLDYFIPAMINQALKGDMTLRGRYVIKDFIYVEDMAEAMIKALNSSYIGPVNIGSGQQTTLETVATFIANYFKRKLDFADVDDKGPSKMQCDNSRALRCLDWSPKVTLEEGLLNTIRYFKENKLDSGGS